MEGCAANRVNGGAKAGWQTGLGAWVYDGRQLRRAPRERNLEGGNSFASLDLPPG
jgi:hypothetical protein